ncbi:MAG: potassium transporter TrkG [Spongiibacteraceae bacterium]
MINAFSALRLLAFPTLIIGIVQFIFGILSIAPFDDGAALGFIEPAVVLIILALCVIVFLQRGESLRVNYRESLLFVSLIWLLSGIASAIPILIIENVSFTDAVFEAISGLTTTGATILTDLDQQPRSFLMYRQFLQWLGGLGMVIFVVAILPMLNVGGMKILKAETPGPMKDEKLAPRVIHTARYLWYVYIVITLLCAAGYFFAGMTLYDAIAHSFSTVSTGGFSTHDASLGYFDGRWVKLNADLFMLLGAINFGLHFRFALSGDAKVYLRDEEVRLFLWLTLGLSVLLFLILVCSGSAPIFVTASTSSTIGLWMDTFLASVFMLISFMTSTGFGADDFTQWPLLAACLLIFSGYLGGCAGSTAGGSKIIRILLSLKLTAHQFKLLVHPRAVFTIRYNGNSVAPEILSAVMVFMTISTFFTLFLVLALNATGLSFWAAFSAVAACLNVVGPGFGELGNNFQPVSDIGTWILSFAMLLGRLEFFTIIVLLVPEFWRR